MDVDDFQLDRLMTPDTDVYPGQSYSRWSRARSASSDRYDEALPPPRAAVGSSLPDRC